VKQLWRSIFCLRRSKGHRFEMPQRAHTAVMPPRAGVWVEFTLQACATSHATKV
jgi:hypothetical protein